MSGCRFRHFVVLCKTSLFLLRADRFNDIKLIMMFTVALLGSISEKHGKLMKTAWMIKHTARLSLKRCIFDLTI